MFTSRSKSLIVRCDGSASIGLGHVMRCLSLAVELRKAGVTVGFAMQEGDGRAVKLVREHCFAVSLLPHGFGQTAASLSTADCRATGDLAVSSGTGYVLVDHYGAGDAYLAALAARARVGVIDDLADRDLTGVSWICNQNLGAEDLPYRLENGCVQVFGPTYALLRPSFALARSQGLRRFSAGDARVLVTLGGGDGNAVTAEILRSLSSVPTRLDICCILGAGGGVPPFLQDIAAESPHKVSILEAVREMADWMSWADLSINAGGSTCWELCCMGVPMSIVVLAANQRSIAAGLATHGCAIAVGEWADGIQGPDLSRAVVALLLDANRRCDMSRRGRDLVDGRGAGRAARSLIESMDSCGEFVK
jgi:UDP-2,4-diacetamido-2,4,6-trideoxy-beta-L-altropyranose hydrolase